MRPLLFIIASSLILSIPGIAATLYVPDNYPTIQGAISASADGDTVIVRPGTYKENIDFLGRAIRVTSEKGTSVTTIDGDQSGSVASFMNGEGLDSVLAGFTITNGTGTWVSNQFCGGGICCVSSSPTLSSNRVTGNTVAHDGGGIYCGTGSSAAILDSEITGNQAASGRGGGVACWYNSESMIRGNLVHSNTAYDHGGGIFFTGDKPLIEGNQVVENSSMFSGGGIYIGVDDGMIRGNLIHGNSAITSGGGMHCGSMTTCLVEDNTISDNASTNNGGGGIACAPNHVTLIANRIHGNAAPYGGGVQCINAPSLIVNNVLYGNTASVKGGGLDAHDGSPVLVNNVFYQNSAGMAGAMQLRYASVAAVTNTIFWDNASPGQVIRVGGDSVLLISHSDLEGGSGSIYVAPNATLDFGTGMIDSDPHFVNANAADFHILYTSPCRDAGDNTPFGLPDCDFEGDPRIADGTADMGADEFFRHLYYTGDAVPGGQVGLHFIGHPGNPVLLFVGSGVLDPPWSTKYGAWYLEFPLLFQGGFGSIPPQGVMSCLLWLSSSLPAPLDIPMQAGIGGKLSNLCVLEVR